MSADTPRRLGRGLEALISTAKQQREAALPAERERSQLQQLRIAEISPNPFQPRRTFTADELAELEGSLRVNGLLQPITVRPKATGGYELVAGERRLRSATRLGWVDIPAVVREFDDRAMLTLALVENLQRANLNPVEEADGYLRLIDEFGLTQQQVGEAVGKDRTTVTTLLRLLTLPAAVRTMVEQSQITAGHARALLVLKEERQQLELAREIVARQLSVREAESRARDMSGRPATESPARSTKLGDRSPVSSDPAARRVEEQLRRHLQTDVSIQQQGGERGSIRIAFYNPEDLDRLLDLMMGKRSDFD